MLVRHPGVCLCSYLFIHPVTVDNSIQHLFILSSYNNYHNIVGEISVFTMSQSTAITTTPLVTVVSTRTSSLTMTVTLALKLMGLPMTVSQHDVVLSPLLMPRDTRGVLGLATVLQ